MFGGWGKMFEVCVMGFMRIVTFKNYFQYEKGYVYVWRIG